jgi:hypothetical protein
MVIVRTIDYDFITSGWVTSECHDRDYVAAAPPEQLLAFNFNFNVIANGR